MKARSTIESSSGDYVRQMNLRNPITTRVYRCILNGFQRFVTEQSQDKSISRETICLWLNDRIRVWPFHLVVHRARLVARFLDWAVKRGAVNNNPFADLRTEYDQRSTGSVVRALLNPDSGAALAAKPARLRIYCPRTTVAPG